MIEAKCLPNCPGQDIFNTVQDFYGTRGLTDDYSLSHMGVPSWKPGTIEYLVAIVADPVQTHLSLFFDRTIDAIQQGALQTGYLFAHATIPWDNQQHAESSDWRLRVAQEQYEREKASQPGLMIFRNTRSEEGSHKESHALFVFIVGETPTGGIHKDQFHHALFAMEAMRDGKTDRAACTLRILGPTFSGSLYSLAEILTSDSTLPNVPIVVRSGTVSSWATSDWFRKQTQCRKPRSDFITFQESDQYSIEKFIQFAIVKGYKAQDIVLLSEDETAYGRSTSPDSKVVQLSFPRDISRLRSAYQQDVLKGETANDKKFSPRTTLPLNLEDTGKGEDSVIQFAHRQTPLSQEAVLLGMVTNLKKHHAQFVVIRATNPLDELFLARFLRIAYPHVRVVTIGADLLFQREQDDARLQGILALTAYPLLPGADDFTVKPAGQGSDFHTHLVFPSSYSAGVYNAVISVLAAPNTFCSGQQYEEVCPSPDKGNQSFIGKQRDLPVAPYSTYGWPILGGGGEPASSELAPPLWLAVLGRDGYWPVALLDSDQYIPKYLSTPGNLHAIDGRIDKSAFSKTFELLAYPPWILLTCVSIVIVASFVILCRRGSITSTSEVLASFANVPDSSRTHVLVVATLLLLAVIASLLWPWVRWQQFTPSAWRWALCVVFLALFFSSLTNLHKRKARIGVWSLFISVLLSLPVLHLLFTEKPISSQNLLLFRSYHISSGVSPLLPCYLLVGAGLWWAWYSLAGLALVDNRRPQLPSMGLNGFERNDLSDEGNQELVAILRSAFASKWTCYKIVLPSAVVVISIALIVGLKHPLQSLEGKWFDRTFFGFLALALFTLLCDLVRFVVAWWLFRRLLQGLERLPLRRGFDRQKGFSWKPIWRLGGHVYRIFSQEMESATHFANRLRRKIEDEKVERLEKKNGLDVRMLQELSLLFDQDFSKSFNQDNRFREQPTAAENLCKTYQHVARTCGCTLSWLEKRWWEESELDEEKETDEDKKTLAPSPSGSGSGYEMLSVAPGVKSAERFVCLVYLNFILSILLRMRTLAFTIGGMYVLILISLSSYPFEPRQAIRSLMVILLVLVLGLVAFVYAQMHRDVTLSRITDTNPGELGLDFWLRLAGFAALPLLSLLASQFPEINGFLFSWFQPALDAMK